MTTTLPTIAQTEATYASAQAKQNELRSRRAEIETTLAQPRDRPLTVNALGQKTSDFLDSRRRDHGNLGRKKEPVAGTNSGRRALGDT
jgi:hypothetical protein